MLQSQKIQSYELFDDPEQMKYKATTFSLKLPSTDVSNQIEQVKEST